MTWKHTGSLSYFFSVSPKIFLLFSPKCRLEETLEKGINKLVPCGRCEQGVLLKMPPVPGFSCKHEGNMENLFLFSEIKIEESLFHLHDPCLDDNGVRANIKIRRVKSSKL